MNNTLRTNGRGQLKTPNPEFGAEFGEDYTVFRIDNERQTTWIQCVGGLKLF